MRWFGKAYGCAYEEGADHTATPVGSACAWCGEPIKGGDTGVLLPAIGQAICQELAYHYECHMRGLVGGIFHQLGWCRCCRDSELPPDPQNVSKRDAARMAVKLWNIKRHGATYPGAEATGAEGQEESPHDKSKRP